MDTRRLSEPNDVAVDGQALEQPTGPAPLPDAEIVELPAVRRPAHAYLVRLAFVVSVVILAGLIAIVGFPTRSSFAFDEPLPNIFAAPAP
jgi:hypothetical protein